MTKRDLRLALFFTLAAAVFRLPSLAYPPEEYFDEVYHAKTALQYLQREPPVEWVHPPTAKLLIAVPVYLFGYRPWAWRLASALTGTLLAPLFFLLARRVLRTEQAAVLATVLLLADGVFLVQSRIAMTNVFAVFFQLAAVLAIVGGVLRERLRVLDFAVGGLFLGLALSTRWTSLWAWGFLALTVVAVRRTRLFSLRELGLATLAFAVLPVVLYFTSYVPWMNQGHTFRDVVDLQKGIWSYHAHLDATHPYFSAWWTWPWLYRPTWYFYRAEAGTVRGIFALGNPALWWAAVPVTFWALLTAGRERDPRLLFAGAGFVLHYLPWGISPRTLNYSHYLFEAIPYACLALGTLLDRLWSRPDGALPSRAYVGVVLLLFALFVPFLMGLPVPESWWGWRIPHGPGLWTWFPRWV